MSFSETTAAGMGSVLARSGPQPHCLPHCLPRSVVPARVPSHRAPRRGADPQGPLPALRPVPRRQSEPCLGAGAPRSGMESVDMEDRLLSFPSRFQSQRVGVGQGWRGLGGRGGEERRPVPGVLPLGRPHEGCLWEMVGWGEVGTDLCTFGFDASCSPKASPLPPTPTACLVLASLIPLVRAKGRMWCREAGLTRKEGGLWAHRPGRWGRASGLARRSASPFSPSAL